MFGIIAHSGLIAKSAGVAPPVDTIVSQLHFDGADGSTTFTDETGKAWTRVGTPTISTAVGGSGGASGYFPGNGCIKSADASGDNFLNWAADDFKIEFDMHPTATPTYSFIVSKRSGGGVYPPVEVGIHGGVLAFNMSSSGTQYPVSMTTPLALNTTHAVKMERIGTSLKGYVNGVEVAATTIPSSIAYYSESLSSPLCIGSLGDGTYAYYGYVDNFKVTKLP